MDPRSKGCKCDTCFLGIKLRQQGEWRPVPAETSPRNTALLVVAEAPGGDEVQTGRPLIGKSGQELMQGMRSHGLERADVTLANAMLCRPPGNDLKMLEGELRRVNRARAKAKQPTFLHPIEACRAQLMEQIARTPYVLSVGASPYQAFSGRRKAIRRIRGALITNWLERITEADGSTNWRVWPDKPGIEALLGGRGIKVRFVPTVHPAFVLRSAEWRPVFRQDIGRWLRWITGKLTWVQPRIVHRPSPDELERFLTDPSVTFYSVDIETGGKKNRRTKKQIIDARDTTKCLLRCIGIGTADLVYIIPFTAIQRDMTFDGTGEPVEIKDPVTNRWRWKIPGAYYSMSDGQKILAILRRFFMDPARTKVGHNVHMFDWPVLRRVLKLPDFPNPTFNTILAARANNSEIPRDLYTQGTLLTDVSAWKSDADDRKLALDPHTNEELWDYCGTDVSVTAKITPILYQGAVNRGQLAALELDHGVQEDCQGMTDVGLNVDQKIRGLMEEEYQDKRATQIRVLQDILGETRKTSALLQEILPADATKFNPRAQTLPRLLYDGWGLPKLGFTAAGDPSVDDATLRKLKAAKVLTRAQEQFIDALRLFREFDKLITTYLIPFRVGNLVSPDGALHPRYNAHCYTPETEVLTPNGWVRFDQLEDGVPVAQWWADSGKIDFAEPTAYRRDDHDGDIIEYESESAHLRMTPEHRMPLRSSRTGRITEYRANNMPRPGGVVTGWSTVHAGEYPGGTGLPLSAAAIQMIVMTQADGHIYRDGGRGIRFAFRKDRKIQRCREILTAAGIPHRETPPYGVTVEHTFYVCGDDVPTYIYTYLGQNKTFGSWVLDLSRPQIDVFLDEVWHWDAVASLKTQYTSTKDVNTDWLQILLVLSGVRANKYYAPREPGHKPLGVIGVRRKTDCRITKHSRYETKPYKGKVYCVEVPSSWIVIRSDGKVTISGNTPVTGRISSSGPNAQNLVALILACITPRPGHVFIGADFDQIELRLFAALAEIELYLKEFARGGDPHAVTALGLYGKIFEAELETKRVTGQKTKLFDELRRMAKVFIYALLYGGTAMTIFTTVSAAEDPETHKLMFPGMVYPEIKAIYDTFMKNMPQVLAYWNKQWAFAATNQYAFEPILGRRRDFVTFERNEILNIPIQGAAAAICSLAMRRITKAFPFDRSRRTGLVNQCHDALLLEVPEKGCEAARQRMQELMLSEFPAQVPGVKFTASAKTGMSWLEVK